MASKRLHDAIGIDPDRVVTAALGAALGEAHSRGKRHHPGRVLAASAALAAAAAVGQRRMPRLAKAPLRMGLHKLGDMTHVDELADALRDRLVGREDEPDEDYDDEPEEFDDEPRDEAEDEPDDEDGDEGFDDEDDEGFDDEPEDDDGPRNEGDEVDEADDEEFDDEPEDDVEGESDEEEPEETEPEATEDDEDLEPEDDEEQIAARSLELGVPSESNGRRARDRVPDLFEALRTPHRRAPVMRREARRVDPATRPPKPDESRPRRERRGRANNPKSTAARA
jgi:hypothetical protein